MKNKIIITFIVILTMALIGIGIFMYLNPVVPPPPPVKPDPHPLNELTNVEDLEIVLPSTRIPKRMVIRNYEKGINKDQINALANAGYKVSYRVLTKGSENYMLVVPYRNNGTMTLSELVWDTYLEEYVATPDTLQFTDEIGENYALLLQYDRPELAKYELKLTQEDGTVTYRITAPAAGAKLPPIEYFAADVIEEDDEIYYQSMTPIEQSTMPSDMSNDEEDSELTE